MSRQDSSGRAHSVSDAPGPVASGVVTLDDDGRVTAVDEPAAALLDRTAAELEGTRVEDVFTGAETREQLEWSRDSQRPVTFDHYVATGERWIEVRSHPSEEWWLFLTDVTEHRAHARELERFRAFVENSSDTISLVDESGRIQYISSAAQRAAGVAPDAYVGTDSFEHIHPEDRATARATFERTLATPDETHRCQYRGQHGDGSWVWLESVSTNRLDHDDIGGVVVVTRDISERKRREEELVELTEEYETVFENADDGVFLIDVESKAGGGADAGGESGHTHDTHDTHNTHDTHDSGSEWEFRYSRINAAHERQTGYASAEVEGKRPRAVLGDDLGSRVEAQYRRCVETQSTVTYDKRITRSGDETVLQTKLAPVVVDGEVRRIVGIARDVTEQIASERELQRKNERLDEFASVISHDIRNPLSVALGRIQLLEEETESEHVAPIARSLHRIGAIVTDTLTLARHGETVADTEPISLTSLVGQCWGTVDVAAATLQVEEEFTIHGDRDRLRHVFENLFNNSVTHGGPTVTVRVGRLGDSGLYVEDDGSGIPETERETVFEPGHRSSTGGTGFGLTIVRRIAEAHGWTVVVTESEAGGARFEFDGVDIVS